MSGSFRKTRRGSAADDADFFAAEAAGLRWLAAAGAPVVGVLAVTGDAIELERLASVHPSADAARQFGTDLAQMHDAGAPRFGSPPDGYRGRQFIGERPLSSTEHDRWGAFYANERVLPYLAPARAAGSLTDDDDADVRAACELIADGVFDDGAPPARLHGDLWSGNVMWTPEGVVMIDPAAHGGHRETDLAMLALFGCPQLDDIVAGYQGARPLRRGWEQRIALHQLHPLAVHAAGHGPSYGAALGRAARTTLLLATRE